MEYTIKVEKNRPDIALYTDIVYKNCWHGFRTQNIPLKINFLRPYYNQWKWEKVPLLIWLEGGAWKTSSPARRIPELTFYAYSGYAVANVQYSGSSQNLWPAQIEDVKEAIRYLKVHHEHFGIDPKRICIAGESAGAHLAALAALTGGTDKFKTEKWKKVSDDVQAAICWYCPGDFSKLSERGEKEQGNYVVMPEQLLVNQKIEEMPELIREISPKTYVGDNIVPFLFFHGTEDHLVPLSCSKSLYEEIINHGGEADYYNVEGAEHASVEFSQEEIQQTMLTFLNKHVKKKCAI